MKQLPKPSKYQRAFYNELTDSDAHLIINAVAGSGKTTTIVNSLDLLPHDSTCPIAFFAFNRDIVTELKKRIKYHNVSVSTLHSFGCRMLMTHYGTLKIDENKAYGLALKLFEQYAGQTKEKKASYAYRVSKLMDMARLTLTDVEDEEAMMLLAFRYGIEVFENEVAGARMVLEASNKLYDERIDFTDMIYLPVIKKLKLRKYMYVFVDELQDLNRVQQELIKMTIHPKGGRFIGVGDPCQSIYGFAGADTESFTRMTTMLPNTKVLPLSICYRCPVEVVELAQTLVPHIQPNPNGLGGNTVVKGSYKSVQQNDWILCRNTKPLVYLFIQLVSEGKNAYIRGREVGANLINLIKRTKAENIEQLVERLNKDRIDLKVKLLKRRVYRPETSQQMAEFDEKFRVIKLLARYSGTIKALIKRITEIFLDDKVGAITLSTIHRAKGEEADRVFIVAPELMPSKYAKTPEDFKQEDNLRYVCITRAKKELIWVNDFNIEKFEADLKELLQ